MTQLPYYISKEDIAELQTMKEFMLEYDKWFLNKVVKQGIQTQEDIEMYHIVATAILKRKADNNVCYKILDTWVAAFEKYYPQLDKKVQDYLDQLRDNQHWSITSKQSFMMDIIKSDIKRIYNQNK